MQNRRDFIKSSATTFAALALLAPAHSCTGQPAPASPADPNDSEIKMAIARWQGGADTPERLKMAAVKLTERAVADLEGLGRFIKKGQSVWVKPNINFHTAPEFAANSNPDVVATVVRLCFEAGAGKVRVGDHSYFGADKSYPMSGIEAAVKAAGAEMVYLDAAKFKEYPINGKVLEKWPLSPEIVEADVLVNVPIAKNHPLPKVSASIKNLMGMAGGDRSTWHEKLPEYLSDLLAFVKPKVHIVDAVRVLTAGPPRGGNLEDVKFIGAVAAGVDAVALDAWASEALGHRPEDIATVTTANARGLGQMDYRKLNPREVILS